MESPWGQKAFLGYLGPDQKAWKEYDPVELLKTYQGPPRRILVDTGSKDPFLEDQLKPNLFQSHGPVTVENRIQPDYDHSYFFVSTWIRQHLLFHSKELKS